MRHHNRVNLLIAFLLLTTLFATTPAFSSEYTIPAQMNQSIKPEISARYKYAEDGEFTKALKIPTYEWWPVDQPPKAIILGVHGLTLHGRRYRVLARTFALHGIGFLSLDMRGFGRCKFDEQKLFSDANDDKRKMNLEKSYADITKLAQLVKEKYPHLPLILMGESLGCTFCVRLAGQHPELVAGMILSAPAIKVNPDMYASFTDIKQGVKAMIRPRKGVSMNYFITKLVSPRPEVVQEMLDDPLILKQVTLRDLLANDKFVNKTVKWSKTVSPEIPVLIIQGGGDKCVVPKDVIALMYNMPSFNQSLRWMGNFGHLQLETSYVRSLVIDALGDWLSDHGSQAKIAKKALEQEIVDTGGVLIQ